MILGETMLRKLKQHSRLDIADETAIRHLSCQLRELADGEDFIHQGDEPRSSAVVLSGTLARYHTLKGGRRQYLSLHIKGDWPDAQGLFLDRMDHSVCAMENSAVCSIPHSELIKLFRDRPTLGFAIWRETLIDAAIFREAITNNGSRAGIRRLAHFFAEIYFRSDSIGLVNENICRLPLTQTQLGELLGMSIITVHRHLQTIRKSRVADLKGGNLIVRNWNKLAAMGDFDPQYLHMRVQPLR